MKDKDSNFSYKGICSDKYSGEYDSQFDFSAIDFTMNVIEKGIINSETRKGAPLKINSKSKFLQNNTEIN